MEWKFFGKLWEIKAYGLAGIGAIFNRASLHFMRCVSYWRCDKPLFNGKDFSTYKVWRVRYKRNFFPRNARCTNFIMPCHRLVLGSQHKPYARQFDTNSVVLAFHKHYVYDNASCWAYRIRIYQRKIFIVGASFAVDVDGNNFKSFHLRIRNFDYSAVLWHFNSANSHGHGLK